MIFLGSSYAVELLSGRVRYQAVLLKDGSWFCVADLREDELRLLLERVLGLDILRHQASGQTVSASILTRLQNAGLDVKPDDAPRDICEKVVRAYGMPGLLTLLD